MAYHELIKQFHRIRPYMRSFYVYGFRYRTQYDEKSARSYDNERRRVESWLGSYMRFGQDADGKRVFLSVDSRAVPSNPLYRAFRAKSFTDIDITLHFLLLDLLDPQKGLTLREILDALERYLEGFENAVLPDESSVRKKLAEYEKAGLIQKEKEGRLVRYTLSQDPISLAGWSDALAFFSESAPLGVVGSYLLDKLDAPPEHFRFKHHYILSALDSEILYDLFLCMEQSRKAVIQLHNRTLEVLPLRIYISTQNGRQYVLADAYGSFRFFRLDLIDSVKPGEPAEVTAELEEKLAAFQQRLWGTAIQSGPPETLEMVIHAQPEEGFLVQRLQREKRNGTVTDLGGGNWLFQAEVPDALELLPWIRTFIGRILSLKSSNPEVEARFRETLVELSRMYGGECDAVQ